MVKCFAHISGEYPHLAKAEIETLLDLISPKIQITWFHRIAVIESQSNPSSFLISRAALLRKTGIIISEEVSIDDLSTIPEEKLISAVSENETFAVETLLQSNEIDGHIIREIPSILGARIREVTGAKVNLDNPNVQVTVVVLPDRLLVCKSTKSWLRSEIREREPGKKEWFHPSMMNAKLARVMCNLAGVLPNETVLDPFCGGGGILCELALIGAKSIGMELNWKFLSGAKTNLDSIIGADYSLIQGDAQYLPIHKCDHIVTDPPYGRSSSTRGTVAQKLVASLLTQSQNILADRANLCICGSSQMSLIDKIEEIGLQLEQHFQIRVHSGLVREIIVARF